MIDPKFTKPYQPGETEPRIYDAWEKSGLFTPEIGISQGHTASDAKPYTIMMPPPNATGILHMGHALGLTIQDILVRYKRMRGFRTLWLPGTDHAAIATQAKVEKDIYKEEKKSRYDLGRDELLRRIGEFVEGSRATIQKQMRVMGTSADWSREAFTFDEPRNRAVNTMFKNMYDAGLIYRGNRIVNWDPKGQTTISDDEIVYEERKAKLYTFKYSKEFPISISTTRPETKVGDTAVAVHPGDPRYKEFVGKTYSANFCGVPIEIKIIADESVEQEFGTGALGVTPAHSQIDWEIAERHQLPVKQVINEYAKMTVGDERILNKKTTEAREAIVEWLRAEGLLEKEEEITQNISTAERTGGIVEPLPKLQWFVNVNKPARDGKTLKELMHEAVASGKVRMISDNFEKIYFNWVNNLRDWCISRQIWYGHRIPVWYCPTCADSAGRIEFEVDEMVDLNIEKNKAVLKRNQNLKPIVAVEAPNKCATCGATDLFQDEDTLDTWFSSGTWTFSTLGWPEKTPDLEIYHPTDVLVTAYEIIFFWVARMILMSQFALGQVPFHTVYFTGVVRDSQGRKFSKSLGNGIDPLDIAAKYGADAGRMALIIGSTPGTDTKISEDRIKGYKHFSNKIWNITRFILERTEDPSEKPKLLPHDEAHIHALDTIVAEVTKEIEEYRLYLAAEKLYHYIWHTLADKIIEESKSRLAPEASAEERASASWTLRHLLRTSLTALHPFMPFITEEIWGSIKGNGEPMLLVTKWPGVATQ